MRWHVDVCQSGESRDRLGTIYADAVANASKSATGMVRPRRSVSGSSDRTIRPSPTAARSTFGGSRRGDDCQRLCHRHSVCGRGFGLDRQLGHDHRRCDGCRRATYTTTVTGTISSVPYTYIYTHLTDEAYAAGIAVHAGSISTHVTNSGVIDVSAVNDELGVAEAIGIDLGAQASPSML